MTQTQTRFLSYEEYLSFDDDTDTRYELVDGVLVEMPPESPENLAIARQLLLELIKVVPIEMVIWGTEIEVSGKRAKSRLPDLMLHSAESLAALRGRSRSTIAHDMPSPALVIEVVSPGNTNRMRDYRYKRTEYAAREIAEYWIVDPEEQKITVCQWIDGAYEDKVFQGSDRLESVVVPQVELTPEQVFNVL
jgi:Uma2 family endonuclease